MLESHDRYSRFISSCDIHQLEWDCGRRNMVLCTQELPSREAVREVIAVADAFWAAHPDEYIAIHCAYGAPRLLARRLTLAEVFIMHVSLSLEPVPAYPAQCWALAG